MPEDPSKNGPYSDGYFLNGVIDNTANYPTPIEAIDTPGFFYTYSSGAANIASSAYSTGYYSSGKIDTTFTGTRVAQDNLQTYYYYAGYVANGPYSAGYYSNGVLNTEITGDFTALDTGILYYYYAGVRADGAYSKGYYNQGVLDTSFNNTATTIDTGVALRFVNGLPADGAYSFGANYTQGVFTPYTGTATTVDTGINFYFYIGLPANGAYSTGYYNQGVLDTSFNNTATTIDTEVELRFVNGLPADGAYSFGANYTQGVFTPYTGIATTVDTDEELYFYQGYPANGAYSDGYYKNGVLDTAYTGLSKTIDTDEELYFYQGLPADGKYSFGVYSQGKLDTTFTGTETTIDTGTEIFFKNGLPADGAYSTGYYKDGAIDTEFSGYETTIDTSERLYFYQGLPADGKYSFGVYSQGKLDTTFTGTETTIDTQEEIYFINGLPASGLYSTGYFTQGKIDTTYNSNVPKKPKDSSNFYLYVNGSASLADGAYSIGYFSLGVRIGNITTPTQALDNQKYYTYNSAKLSVLVNGYYSTGAYISGLLDIEGVLDTTTAVKAIDDQNYYTYSKGIPTPSEKVIMSLKQGFGEGQCACGCGIRGCVNPKAYNYQSSANIDDGSCENICGCWLGPRIFVPKSGTVGASFYNEYENVCINSENGENGVFAGTCPGDIPGTPPKPPCCDFLYAPCNSSAGCTFTDPLGVTGSTGLCGCIYVGCPTEEVNFTLEATIGCQATAQTKIITCAEIVENTEGLFEFSDMSGVCGIYVKNITTSGKTHKYNYGRSYVVEDSEKPDTSECSQCEPPSDACLSKKVSCAPDCPEGFDEKEYYGYLCCGTTATTVYSTVVEPICLEFEETEDPETGEISFKCVKQAYITTSYYSGGESLSFWRFNTYECQPNKEGGRMCYRTTCAGCTGPIPCV